MSLLPFDLTEIRELEKERNKLRTLVDDVWAMLNDHSYYDSETGVDWSWMVADIRNRITDTLEADEPTAV